MDRGGQGAVSGRERGGRFCAGRGGVMLSGDLLTKFSITCASIVLTVLRLSYRV